MKEILDKEPVIFIMKLWPIFLSAMVMFGWNSYRYRMILENRFPKRLGRNGAERVRHLCFSPLTYIMLAWAVIASLDGDMIAQVFILVLWGAFVSGLIGDAFAGWKLGRTLPGRSI